jgi:chaperone required for assembly of F1-ATPase
MADDLSDLFFRDGPPRMSPLEAARAGSQPSLPRRFYKQAGVLGASDGYVLTLDGRPARTPGKAPLALPSRAAADAVAEEWNRQADIIDPATMPLTRLANTAIDGVASRFDDVAAEVARYGASDLLCYRAADPARLVARQVQTWDPVLTWADEGLGARFLLAEGVMFVAQPEPSLAAIAAAVHRFSDPFALASLSTMTTLTGSVVLALAVAHGRLSPQEAWAAAHVDEDFQMELWGEDDEAMLRRAARWREMEAAALLLASVRVSD